MKTKEETHKFNSFLQEKCILQEKLQKVYDYIIDENYDEALYDLENMNRRYPYIADIYHLKFKIYCIKENYSLADKVITEAEGIFQDNEKIKEDREYLNIVKNAANNKYLMQKKYLDLAKSSSEEIEKKDPDKVSVSSYYYRALSYRMLNNESNNDYYKEACRVYGDLGSKRKDNTYAHLYKSLCHKDMKEYGEALKEVNCVLDKNNENKEALKVKLSIIKELQNRNSKDILK